MTRTVCRFIHLGELLGIASILACKGATSPPGPGTVVFRMDAASCSYAGAKQVTFYIERADVGTESMQSGGASVGYVTNASESYAKPGKPVVQARIANYTAAGGALWTARVPVNVTSNVDVTHVLVC